LAKPRLTFEEPKILLLCAEALNVELLEVAKPPLLLWACPNEGLTETPNPPNELEGPELANAVRDGVVPNPVGAEGVPKPLDARGAPKPLF
jgi:hypothetical protein